MRIPESIALMGHTFDIVWDDRLVHNHEALGLTDYRNFLIKLQPNTEQYPIPDSLINQVYLHEVLHCIFDILHLEDMKNDEKLVDNIAGLLNQALNNTQEII